MWLLFQGYSGILFVLLGNSTISNVPVRRMAQQEEKNKKLLNKLIGIREEISLSQPKCTMHFAKQPMKLSRGNKQYVYDESGKAPTVTALWVYTEHLAR